MNQLLWARNDGGGGSDHDDPEVHSIEGEEYSSSSFPDNSITYAFTPRCMEPWFGGGPEKRRAMSERAMANLSFLGHHRVITPPPPPAALANIDDVNRVLLAQIRQPQAQSAAAPREKREQTRPQSIGNHAFWNTVTWKALLAPSSFVKRKQCFCFTLIDGDIKLVVVKFCYFELKNYYFLYTKIVK